MLYLLCALIQQDPTDGLRSWDVQDREAAVERLKTLGPAALPALLRARRDSDPEVAERARLLVRYMEIQTTLDPRLTRRDPRLVDRLAYGTDRTWIEVCLEITDAELLAIFVPSVVPRANNTEDRKAVFRIVVRLGARDSIHHLVPFLKDLIFQRELGDGVRLLVTPKSIEPLARLYSQKDPVGSPLAIRLIRDARPDQVNTVLDGMLHDADADVRNSAVDVVAALPVNQATDITVSLLGDPHPATRTAAVSALRRTDARRAAPRIVLQLGDTSDPAVRERIADALIELGWKEALSPLARLRDRGIAEAERPYYLIDRNLRGSELGQLFQSKDSQARRLRSESLVEKNSIQDLPEILGYLGDHATSDNGFRALSRLDSKALIPEILELMRSDGTRLPDRAADALVMLKAVEAGPELVRMLESENPEVRRRASETILRLELKNLAPLVAGLMKSPRRDVKRIAVSTLLGLGGAQSSSFQALLESPDPDDRITATRALAGLKGLDGRAGLSGRLTDVDPAVRAAAAEAIGARKADDLATEVEDLLEDSTAEVRVSAIQSLRQLGSRGSAARLRALRSDRNPSVRVAVARALATLGGTADDIAPLLADASPAVRSAAALSLSEVNGPAKLLRPMLRDENSQVRAAAAEGLERLRDRESVTDLTAALEDRDPRVRARAADALRAIQR